MTDDKIGCRRLFCAIEGCGEIDETHSAYCIHHSRSIHYLCGENGNLCPSCQKKQQTKTSISQEIKSIRCEEIIRHGLKLFPNLTREEFFNLKFKLVEPTRIKWDNRIWREEK
jgi:hypothetical protein